MLRYSSLLLEDSWIKCVKKGKRERYISRSNESILSFGQSISSLKIKVKVLIKSVSGLRLLQRHFTTLDRGSKSDRFVKIRLC